MNPTSFPEMHTTIARNQPPYLPLPAHVTAEGEVISCWRLSVWERVRLLFTGRLWLRQLAWGLPLQPQCVQVENPFAEKDGTSHD